MGKKPPSGLADGNTDPKSHRLLLFLGMQAIAVAVVLNIFKNSGVLDIALSYGEAYNPFRVPCGWLPEAEYALLSDRIVLPYGVFPGYVHVRGRMIAGVGTGATGADRHKVAGPLLASHKSLRVLDYGSAVISPGLIDVHVHMDEPGREHWEGMDTGTRAAAAGGFTTLIDMPLNSHPCTTTPQELKRKIEVAKAKVLVDTGFWAGLVPQNAYQPKVLRAMVAGGALGFKAFMSPSGIDDFDNVSPADVAAALPTIKALGVPLLVHAELVDEDVPKGGNPREFSTWLASRPRRFEKNAIRALINVLKEDTTPAAPGFRLHIVHLSDADMLPELAAAKAAGLPLSVETCPHYLNFAAEDIPDGDTRFKCAPPLRERENIDRLWGGLRAGVIDALSTDHSPADPPMRLLEDGDFMRAWGGIAGLQYALPSSWDGAEQHGLNLTALAALWSRFPAELAGLSKTKGRLASGMDADLVVWAPEEAADTSAENLYHRHKVNPYEGRQLRGRVEATIVLGRMVFSAERGPWREAACGKAILKK